MTIDAPYLRETVAEARRYRRQGVLTVEMEAAALFAVGRYGKPMSRRFSPSATRSRLREVSWKQSSTCDAISQGGENLPGRGERSIAREELRSVGPSWKHASSPVNRCINLPGAS